MEVTTNRDPKSLDITSLRGCAIIGIDGDNGAGKSTLAKEIQVALGGMIVEVDNFLLGNRQPYLAQLDFPRLAEVVRTAKVAPIVLEGILLLDVLDKLDIQSTFLIFSKLEWVGMNRYGAPAEITEYYHRRSPWRAAHLVVTLRQVFSFHNQPKSKGRI